MTAEPTRRSLRRSRRVASPPAIVCSDLSIARMEGRRPSSTRVIDGLSFTLPRAANLALMGPTGGGKSSIAALLAGVDDSGLTIVGGAATVAGIPLTSKRHRRAVAFTSGYLGQGDGASLPARLTVAEVIGSPVTQRTRRFNAAELSLRTASLLDELLLPLGISGRYPYELSAGMRQRVALARALILDPRVLIADDLFANLDLEAREAVRLAIARRRAATGMSTLVVTNEIDVVHDIDADTLVIQSGHMVAYGKLGEEMLWTPDEAAVHRELMDGDPV